ncbi:MAG: hypothetical protein LBR10_09310 [Prevotellaceae bacterium]|jgi:hypothetical protein|nr:hypothetical protein [Prevotellaceae bacterium]
MIISIKEPCKSFILCILCCFCFTVCKKPDFESVIQVPQLSHRFISIKKDETVEIKIIKGIAPYIVEASPKGIVNVILNEEDNKLVISGIKVGETIITLICDDGGIALLPVTVTEN